ncbi:DNA ligase [Pseudomonas phage Misse]|nr:DNA ligase [Pseudomonas phage Misse]
MAQLMKGETFKDALKLVRGKPRFEYPIFVEVKADEIRCQVKFTNGCRITNRLPVVEYLSYSGKPLHNMEHFTPALILYFCASEFTELDIGIEVNGNFNDSYRWTQSSSGIPQEKFDKKTQRTSPALDVGMVKLIVFDLPESLEKYEVRRRTVINTADHLRRCGLNATFASGCIAENEAEVWAIYNNYREAGHEGAMGKTLHHTYSRRRTFDWMKIKPSEDHDGQITSFNEAVSESGEPLGRVGSINVTCADASTAAPAGIPHELGRELWENQHKYIGQWIEFYCMERDRQGGYRHPIYHRFREAKA